ncbi:hypothetical protein CYLTODRAFT_491267 [Cylindrobasidium torrendii FP15055 ss-10]|uniref:Uncharacterized protein n=1 Tax=Cylindrobasidium torrendii FP15055 ss-10 TaxID=1314674 RepID=A0A0D7B8Z9_9AGAR|nr:hypothetical protein CYLTODRAFT_491267 [Cylindrobasidium torrendii FP15055 ss-10]
MPPLRNDRYAPTAAPRSSKRGGGAERKRFALRTTFVSGKAMHPPFHHAADPERHDVTNDDLTFEQRHFDDIDHTAITAEEKVRHLAVNVDNEYAAQNPPEDSSAATDDPMAMFLPTITIKNATLDLYGKIVATKFNDSPEDLVFGSFTYGDDIEERNIRLAGIPGHNQVVYIDQFNVFYFNKDGGNALRKLRDKHNTFQWTVSDADINVRLVPASILEVAQFVIEARDSALPEERRNLRKFGLHFLATQARRAAWNKIDPPMALAYQWAKTAGSYTSPIKDIIRDGKGSFDSLFNLDLERNIGYTLLAAYAWVSCGPQEPEHHFDPGLAGNTSLDMCESSLFGLWLIMATSPRVWDPSSNLYTNLGAEDVSKFIRTVCYLCSVPMAFPSAIDTHNGRLETLHGKKKARSLPEFVHYRPESSNRILKGGYHRPTIVAGTLDTVAIAVALYRSGIRYTDLRHAAVYASRTIAYRVRHGPEDEQKAWRFLEHARLQTAHDYLQRYPSLGHAVWIEPDEEQEAMVPMPTWHYERVFEYVTHRYDEQHPGEDFFDDKRLLLHGERPWVQFALKDTYDSYSSDEPLSFWTPPAGWKPINTIHIEGGAVCRQLQHIDPSLNLIVDSDEDDFSLADSGELGDAEPTSDLPDVPHADASMETAVDN